MLGAGTGQSDANGLAVNLAANLLNLLLDPGLSPSTQPTGTGWRLPPAVPPCLRCSELVRGVEVLILNNCNPVFSLPPESGAKAALATPNLFVVSLSNFLDETSRLADLILPVSLPLETWDDYSGWAPLVSTLQPAMGKITAARIWETFSGSWL